MRIKRAILLIFLAFGVLLFVVPQSFADQHAQIELKRRHAHAKIKRLKMLESMETNKLYKNQKKLTKAKQDLSISKQKYTTTQSRLANLTKSLQVAQANFSQTESAAKKRVCNIYKGQRSALLEVMLNAKDINDLMDKIYYQDRITKKDKYKMSVYREQSKRIASYKYQMEVEKQILANSIQDIDKQQKSLKSAIGQNESMIQKLKNDRIYYEKSERELARQSATLRRMINRTTSSSINVSTGFMRPVGGPITSSFGWRVHPIFKSRTFHSGVDIGARYGSPIRASNSGRVIYSGWYGGYGNVVIIDHGHYNGVPTTTLYAHMSNMAVSIGQNVVRGQTIGYVGSTGYSTGPHLHFEVRCNGEPNNPLRYI